MRERLKTKAKEALSIIKEAVAVRAQITEIYGTYRELTDLACEAANLKHGDVKRAVDALYYLGGGWPRPNSKGRMEALLDNFVGMYRILDFIGSGDVVEQHLAKYGVTVKMDDEFKIDDRELTTNEIKYLGNVLSAEYYHLADVKTVRELVSMVVMQCQDLQRKICGLADTIKEELRPKAMKRLEVEDEEYDRLHDLVRASLKDTPRALEKVQTKKVEIHQSISNFNVGLVAMKEED